MKKLTPVAFAVVAALSTIADQALACENDAQCKGDRVCTNGECVDPPSRAGQSVPAVVTPPAGTPPGTLPAQAPPPGATPPPTGVAPPPGAQAGWPPGAYAPPPGYAPPAEPPMRRRVGLLVTGSVLGGLGVFGLVIGGLTFAAGSDAASLCNSGWGYDPSAGDTCDDDEATRDIGGAIMIGSGIALAGSIPLIIIGARKVPVERDQALRHGVTLAIAARRGGLGIAGTF